MTSVSMCCVAWLHNMLDDGIENRPLRNVFPPITLKPKKHLVGDEEYLVVRGVMQNILYTRYSFTTGSVRHAVAVQQVDVFTFLNI